MPPNSCAKVSGLAPQAASPGFGSYNPNDQLSGETYDNNGNVTRTANGNVISYSDSIDNNSGSIMGSWSFNYDALNRLQSGQATAGAWAGQNLCWAYDSFGNRTAQSTQTAACPSPSQESSLQPTASYNANNWVTWVQNTAPAGFGYDYAGDVTYDGANYNSYDAEGRVCAVQGYPFTGGVVATGYLYDAEGTRVRGPSHPARTRSRSR
jgi:hypothetical protein